MEFLKNIHEKTTKNRLENENGRKHPGLLRCKTQANNMQEQHWCLKIGNVNKVYLKNEIVNTHKIKYKKLEMVRVICLIQKKTHKNMTHQIVHMMRKELKKENFVEAVDELKTEGK